MYVAAASPQISPATPPPKATATERLSILFSKKNE
jgi:hypothetical protein